MNERIEKFLYDILSCVEKIQQYTDGMGLDEYLLDEKTQDAVERNFEIIGEAMTISARLTKRLLTKSVTRRESSASGTTSSTATT